MQSLSRDMNMGILDPQEKMSPGSQGDLFQDTSNASEVKRIGGFVASREAALRGLESFLSGAADDYRKKRNVDFGSNKHAFVSQLSPYISSGLISEKEIIIQVLERHSLDKAYKFIQEVFWRSYWKGWLEHRPNLWQCYWELLTSSFDSVMANPAAQTIYFKACEGQTDIAVFNSWVKELKETGYLHNHARMWFASIWIFTFKLPWELGADLFYRYLLDGDPATNTLSWRWVAGLHTRGKIYLATKQNIAKFAKGRLLDMGVGDRGLENLSQDALTIQENLPSSAFKLAAVQEKRLNYQCEPDERRGFLFTEGGLSTIPPDFITNAAGLRLEGRSPIESSSDLVDSFLRQAIRSTLSRIATEDKRLLVEDRRLLSIREVVEWAKKHQLTSVLVAYAPQGPCHEALKVLKGELGFHDIELKEVGSAYDQSIWRHSRRGFFHLNNKIPEILQSLDLVRP